MKMSNLKKAVISVLLLLVMPAVHAAGWSGNVSGFLGQKSLDNNDWPRYDKQTSLGLIFDFKLEHLPVSIAVDLIVSGDSEESGTKEDVAFTVEQHIGIRKIFEPSNSSVKPYIGGGIAYVIAGMENKDGDTTVSQDDAAIGAWAGMGMYLALTPHVSLGLDVRYSEAEVTLFRVEREAGGLHAGITAGYHW